LMSERRGRLQIRFIDLVVVAVLAALFGGTALSYVLMRHVDERIGALEAQIQSVVAQRIDGLFSVRPVVERLMGSVVKISSTAQSELRWGFGGLELYRPRKLGSGVVFDEQGYILTNHHVIEDAEEIVVELQDGKALMAKVIGSDRYSDLAVLKIDANNLTAARLGDSSAIRVGDVAIAIGNPYGYDYSVTQGIISGVRERITIDGLMVDVIQTDAPINPGNSGGALVNSSGDVIGINTYVVEGAQGLGFAIPSNEAARIAQDLIAHGYVMWPWSGIGEVYALKATEARQLGLPVNYGALVTDVTVGGPAQRAGLRRGDVIIKVNGDTVTTGDEIVYHLRKCRAGDRLTLVVIRDSRELEITIQLEEGSASYRA
jgi:S1-C subfamily serine protease